MVLKEPQRFGNPGNWSEEERKVYQVVQALKRPTIRMRTHRWGRLTNTCEVCGVTAEAVDDEQASPVCLPR